MQNSQVRINNLAEKLKTEVLTKLSIGERLPSERTLAEMMKESQNRVHRAIHSLLKDEYLSASGNRNGYFLRSSYPHRAKMNLAFGTSLTLGLPLVPKHLEAQQWRHICDRFMSVNPGLKINIVYQESPDFANADVFLTWPHLALGINRDLNFMELKAEDFFSADDISKALQPNILQTGCLNGKLLGIPVAYAPAAYWANRNILRKAKLRVSDFCDPLDYFRWGGLFYSQFNSPIAFAFAGFVYHSIAWGVEYKREGNYYVADPEKLKMFLSESKPYLKKMGILFNYFNNLEILRRGAVYISPHYLSALPLTEYRFQLLDYPIRKGGFANQAVFLLALNRDTKKADWGKEFIRFALGNLSQNILFEPITKLSVWKLLDMQQRQIILERTSATVPLFDIRGLRPGIDMDFDVLASYFLTYYSETFFKKDVSLESTVEMMSRLDLRQHKDFITFRWQAGTKIKELHE